MIPGNREKWPVGAELAPLLTAMKPVVDPPLPGKDQKKAEGGNRSHDQCPIALVDGTVDSRRGQNPQAEDGESKPLPGHDLRADTSVVGNWSCKNPRQREGSGGNNAHQNELLNVFVDHANAPLPE